MRTGRRNGGRRSHWLHSPHRPAHKQIHLGREMTNDELPKWSPSELPHHIFRKIGLFGPLWAMLSSRRGITRKPLGTKCRNSSTFLKILWAEIGNCLQLNSSPNKMAASAVTWKRQGSWENINNQWRKNWMNDDWLKTHCKRGTDMKDARSYTCLRVIFWENWKMKRAITDVVIKTENNNGAST